MCIYPPKTWQFIFVSCRGHWFFNLKNCACYYAETYTTMLVKIFQDTFYYAFFSLVSGWYIQNKDINLYCSKTDALLQIFWICQLTWVAIFNFLHCIRGLRSILTLTVFRLCVTEGSGEWFWEEHSPIVKCYILKHFIFLLILINVY